MNVHVYLLWQDIKAASLRTLTSIVHLERTPKLSNIIDCTGTASYHGFLPVLVRNCIQAMIGKKDLCFHNEISHKTLFPANSPCPCQTHWWSRTRTSLPQLSFPSCTTWPVMMRVERPWSHVGWWRPCWRLVFVSFLNYFLLKHFSHCILYTMTAVI